MATLTVQISDALMERLDREVASGRYKDSSVLVQQLLESAIRMCWKDEAEQKVEERLMKSSAAKWRHGNLATMGALAESTSKRNRRAGQNRKWTSFARPLTGVI